MKDYNLQVRLTQAERDTLRMAADAAGLSLSAWLRDRLRKAARAELQTSGLKVPFLEAIPPLTAQAARMLARVHGVPADGVMEEVVSLVQMRDVLPSFCFVLDAADAAAPIAASVQSALRQTAPNWELLLVSRPGEGAHLRAWLDADWRIRHVEAADGDVAAIAEAATADFLAPLRAGDCVDDDYILSAQRRLRASLKPLDLLCATQPASSPPGDALGSGAAIRKSLWLQLCAALPVDASSRPVDLLRAAHGIAPARRVEARHVEESVRENVSLEREKEDAAAQRKRMRHEADVALRAFRPGWRNYLNGRARRFVAQARAVLESGLFDRAYYLAANPDVRAAGVDPLLHYMQHGDMEGRFPNPVFDPRFYRGQFEAPDLGDDGALLHYARHGEAAGLSASAAFNALRYRTANGGIVDDDELGLSHYLRVGRKAGLSAQINPRLPAGVSAQLRRPPATPPVDTAGLRRAVNVIGPLDRVAGLGVSARGYFEGAEKSGFGPVGARTRTREYVVQNSLPGVRAFPGPVEAAAINLVHVNGDALPIMLEDGGRELLENRYNVAIWYWELAALRPEWVAMMKCFHEFWAPTPFIARTIARSSNKPIRLIPPYLSYLRAPTAAPPPPHTGPAQFLYCFDANSILDRKNPGALLDAFMRAFPADGAPARLTFKITHPNRAIEEVERLYRAAAADPRVEIVDKVLSEAELQRLIAGASAYVSPHRSEGLGLTMIEAMACGVPVIATPYGGLDAFLGADAAWPVPFRLIELTQDHPPYPRGFVWADPDVNALAAALRAVLADPAAAARRAQIARARVLDAFASDALLGVYRNELERIAAQLALPSRTSG